MTKSRSLEPARPAERRALERLFACEHANRATLSDGARSWPVGLLTFTAAGVGLVSQRPVEAGADLSLRLGPLGAARSVRVMHVTEIPSTGYLLGAKFHQRLSFVELQALNPRSGS
jgi:hypothetical protein